MSRVSRGFHIAGWIIKLLFSLIIGIVIGLLLWRMVISTKVPDSVKVIDGNDRLFAVYNEKGGNPEIFRQEQASITKAEKNYGYFANIDTKIIPDANQIQLLFRYNNSTIRSMAQDYQLAEVPSRSEELFDVTLLLAIDLTPEDASDNDGNHPESVRFVRCHGKISASAEKNMYNYRRFVFDFDETGENLRNLLNSKTLLAVYADVYYVGDLDYNKEPYGTLCLYDYASENIPVKLTGKDKKALGGKQ